MQNLLQFILRYGSFFTFLILEAICIFMLVNYNESQREIYLYSSQLTTGKIYDSFHEIQSYAHLREVNDSLAGENAKLKAQLLSLKKDSTVTDTFEADFDIIACEVINNSILGRNNMMTLDKGLDHNLEKSMGIIGPSGIVGIVKRCGQNYSTAYSILNTDLRISARISRTNYFGTLSWPAKDIKMMVLRAIPKHADVRIGDTVTTTSFSNIFPADIPIGVVENVDQRPGRADFSIDVKLINDMSNLSFVYAVKKKDKADRESIEANNE